MNIVNAAQLEAKHRRHREVAGHVDVTGITSGGGRCDLSRLRMTQGINASFPVGAAGVAHLHAVIDARPCPHKHADLEFGRGRVCLDCDATMPTEED